MQQMKYYLWLGHIDLLDLVLAYTVLTSHLLSHNCYIQICVPKLTYRLQTPTRTLMRLNTVKQIKLKLALSSPSAHIPHSLTNQFLLVKSESYPIFPLEYPLASLPKTRAGTISQSKHDVPGYTHNTGISKALMLTLWDLCFYSIKIFNDLLTNITSLLSHSVSNQLQG